MAVLSEEKYDVFISAPNREIEMENLRPLRAELPAVWSDISNAMRRFKDHSLHMLVLDEVLGFELSNFSRQLKLKPGIDDDHRVMAAMSNDLWFRGMELRGEGEKRNNSKETRAHLEVMVLRTKPEANPWLHITSRIAALGADAFEQGPVMIKKVHAYLVNEVNLAENAPDKSAEFVNRVCQVTLEALWNQKRKGEEGFDRTDSMLEGLGAGWTASFLAKIYPILSRYLIKEFLQADLSLAMRTDPLALIRGATEFVTVIYGPAVTFAFPDVKVEAYRRWVLHLNVISAVDGSALNWCEQHVLRELMSEDLWFAQISEPKLTVVNFDDHFRDRMGEVYRGHIEVFRKLWNLMPYDKTNGEITRIPRLTAAYHKVREETKGWGDYKKLPEEIPELPLIRRMLLGAVSLVQTPRLRAFETNERRVDKFSETMDPCFVGRNAAVLQHTRFVYTDQATRRRISNAATAKLGGFDKEWAKLDLAPMKMRGRAELPEFSLILTSVKPELTVGGTLQTRALLAPFGYEDVKIIYGEEEDLSAGKLVLPRFPEGSEVKSKGAQIRKINQREMMGREEAVNRKNL